MEELLTIILNVTKYIARWCRLGRSCHRISKLTLVTPDLNASYSATEKLSSMRFSRSASTFTFEDKNKGGYNTAALVVI